MNAVAEGLEESKQYISQLIDLQLDLASQAEKKVFEWIPAVDYTEDIYQRVEAIASPKMAAILSIAGKQDRNTAEEEALAATIAELGIAEDDAVHDPDTFPFLAEPQ